MRAKVLLDTDILSEVMKGKDPIVVEHARRYLADAGQLTFSAISVMEVVAGYSRQRTEEKLQRFLQMANRSEVIPFEMVVAELAGRIHRGQAGATQQRKATSEGACRRCAARRCTPGVTLDELDRLRRQPPGLPSPN